MREVIIVYAFQEEPPSKKKRVESSINWTGMVWLHFWNVHALHSSTLFLSDEVDEIEVYGSEAQSGTQLATYSFEVTEWIFCMFLYLFEREQNDLSVAVLQVCDSILNIGPCANASMGEPAFLSEEVQAEHKDLLI